jgi:hypothetical protein
VPSSPSSLARASANRTGRREPVAPRIERLTNKPQGFPGLIAGELAWPRPETVKPEPPYRPRRDLPPPGLDHHEPGTQTSSHPSEVLRRRHQPRGSRGGCRDTWWCRARRERKRAANGGRSSAPRFLAPPRRRPLCVAALSGISSRGRGFGRPAEEADGHRGLPGVAPRGTRVRGWPRPDRQRTPVRYERLLRRDADRLAPRPPSP